MRWVDCTDEQHGEAILAIFNEAIVHSTALYDYEPRTRAQMTSWFEAKRAGSFPVIGVESESGELMGFASYGAFRAWPAYKYTVEHSVYVHPEHRGKGLAPELMQVLIRAAKAQGKHVLVGVIDAGNAVSIRLHQRLGFVHAGTVRQAGFKFGQWLDIDLYQLILETPATPRDG